MTADSPARPSPRRRARRALTSVPLRLLRRIIEENDYATFATVSVAGLNEEEAEIYERVRAHHVRHRSFPQPLTLQEWRVDLPEAPEPTSYYRDQMYQNMMVRTAAAMMQDLSQAIEANDGEAIASLLIGRRQEIAQTGPSVVSLRGMADTFRETLRPSNSVLSMIGTGIAGLDEEVGGIKAGDIGVLAARPGVGKTFLQLKGAMDHALEGIRVSFLTKEMSEDQVAHRVFAMYYDLDPRMGVQKRVSTAAFEQVMEMMQDDVPDTLLDNLMVVPPSAVRTTADWFAILRDQRPDIGMIDGTYFMQPHERRSFNSPNDRLETLIREIRQGALECRIANWLTWQQNRGKAMDTSGLYGTDALSQDAGLAVIVRKKRGHNNMRVAEVIKNRHGPEGEELGLSYSMKPTNLGTRVAIPTPEARERTAREGYVDRAVQSNAGTSNPPARREVRRLEIPE